MSGKMKLTTPGLAPKRNDMPPLVSKETSRHIRLGVIAGHLLFIGVPLAVMCILSWMYPPPEKLMMIEITNDRPFNPLAEKESPEDAPPEPTSAPLPPSAIDTRPAPKPDPIPKPIPAPPPPTAVVPAQKTPKPDPQPKPKPSQMEEPRTTRDVTFKPMDPSTIGQKPDNPHTSHGGEHDPRKPVNPTGTSPDAALRNAVAALFYRYWDGRNNGGKPGLKPNAAQLGGTKPQVIIEMNVTSSGVVSAKLKTPSGVPAMDIAARKLCEILNKQKLPPPDKNPYLFVIDWE